MLLEKGRPNNLKNRLEKEIKVYELLDSLGIEYYRVDHEPLMNMEACKDVDNLLEATVCKNLFLRNSQKTKFYLLMLPGDKKFVTKDLSKQIESSRLSFAEPEYMEKFLNITPGSVSVMGLMNDKKNRVQLLIDIDILKGEYIGCHPCINTSSIKLKTKQLIGIFLKELKHEPIIVNL
ncbi:prolyl-tRNA synthetase associated domain-containing protein [Sedimentibacter sp. zth1]|uniref:prolyl-tRNA synthetase associated domain-containing protein n=1 Tax=Sedimentibacter sp. zth1 TaxID=2816908 RepID=UPI001A92109A|nr:prolyl-tRNA synthetase associated domain-containing protein [Sedimentibacter sp. zth1]QSX06493.1 prolyl-tRNA synthetase associated domain-containing protein [Sedimentibacter sp. zth1]